MNRERQTLELLTLLGDDVANAVLERLQPERAQTLRTGMNNELLMKSTISRQREVLDEFECFFQFALKSKLAEEVAREKQAAAEQLVNAESASQSSTNDSVQASDSKESAEPVVAASVNGTPGSEVREEASPTESYAASSGTVASNEVQQSPQDATGDNEEDAMASVSKDVVKPAVLKDSDNPIDALTTLSVHQIASALESEQSRTTAILLSQIPAKLTGEVLNLFKPEYQKLVMKELTKEQHAPKMLIERIARATFLRASQLPSEPPDGRNHADKVAEMLRSVPKAGRRNMLAAIEEQDPDLAKSLLTRIYRFDDITSLGKTVVQRVLGEVDSTNLTTALCGAPEDVKEAIFSNLSKRARQTIEEEMQFMTNVAESRIRQARDSIAEVIAKIDMEGEPE